MDKETLSNYGWIVICVLVLAVMLALASPFGQFVSDAVWSATNGLFDTNQNALFAVGIDQVEETKYYSALTLAFDDATAKTTENADSDAENAVASINIHQSGKYEVVMLTDTSITSQYIITNGEFDFNVNGKTLSVDGAIFRMNGGNIVINGNGGKISSSGVNASPFVIIGSNTSEVDISNITLESSATTGVSYGISLQADGEHSATLRNCTIISSTGGNNAIGIYLAKNARATTDNCKIQTNGEVKTYSVYLRDTAIAKINNSTIEAIGNSNDTVGLYAIHSSNALVNNSRINAVGESNVYGIYLIDAICTANNSTIVADSMYNLSGDAANSYVQCGIGNYGTLLLNTSKVIGVHCGVSNHRTATINGGHLASPTHGGIYNCKTLYIQEATLENCDYSGVCVDETLISNLARNGAMYNGGGENAVAYIDNCKFINNEASYGLVVSTNYQHKSPSVYVSNCNLTDFRVDGERTDNIGQIGTAYIGKNVTYNLKQNDTSVGEGDVDTTTYADVAFNTEWLKAQGIIE